MQKETLQDFLDKMETKLEGFSYKTERERKAVLYSAAGLTLMKRGFDEVGLSFKAETGIEVKRVMSMLRKSPSLEDKPGDAAGEKMLHRYLDIMSEMAARKLLTERVHYDVVVDENMDYILRLNYNSFYKDFVLYCQENEPEKEVLPVKGFRHLLKSNTSCKSFNQPVWFTIEGGIEKKRRAYRAAILYVIDLKRKKVNLDGFL